MCKGCKYSKFITLLYHFENTKMHRFQGNDA